VVDSSSTTSDKSEIQVISKIMGENISQTFTGHFTEPCVQTSPDQNKGIYLVDFVVSSDLDE